MRVIGNFKSNDVNDHGSAWERVSTDREDVITEAILQLMQGSEADGGRRRDVHVGVDDYVGAYKTLSPAAGHQWMCHVLVFDTDDMVWRTGELHTLAFGCVASVMAWWRCATARRF